MAGNDPKCDLPSQITRNRKMQLDQRKFEVRCEWGLAGLSALGPDLDATIIVDVLSFSTCVDIVTSRGGIVYPYQYRDSSATEYATARNAVLAGSRSSTEFSLSPSSLLDFPDGAALVLPSPNGSTISLSTQSKVTIAGCLRNATAVIDFIQTQGLSKIAVIACGEHWPDGSLRPCFEDLVGAGAIIFGLSGSKSPESIAAQAVFLAVRDTLDQHLLDCVSGMELLSRSFQEDVQLASQLNVSHNVPLLEDGYYRSA